MLRGVWIAELLAEAALQLEHDDDVVEIGLFSLARGGPAPVLRDRTIEYNMVEFRLQIANYRIDRMSFAPEFQLILPEFSCRHSAQTGESSGYHLVLIWETSGKW